MVASTEDDATHLMAMFLGVGAGVKILASVVNDPDHECLSKRMAENRFFHGDPIWPDHAFQWISALSTAGYQTLDVNEWSTAKKEERELGLEPGTTSTIDKPRCRWCSACPVGHAVSCRPVLPRNGR